eukprot:8066938-Pyramimonas_sp.AAC.1
MFTHVYTHGAGIYPSPLRAEVPEDRSWIGEGGNEKEKAFSESLEFHWTSDNFSQPSPKTHNTSQKA